MRRHTFFAIAAALLSAGWLFPLWLGMETSFSFWQMEGWPRLLGERPGHSFPFLSFASDCFRIAFFWLGAVLLFWSYLGARAYLRTCAA
ncbi:hypothetical protein [Luteimonas sp. 3794]|uniref:hypothetical protein n=1 Tax=Luteimonas sp. 3794 TaxID=2817730 RepID=UPI0028596726|nr:hypothetical protein [Luteimonas sp. 3794]MDR6992624.1 hypothetical protein [Luteimonas sp. 3794]